MDEASVNQWAEHFAPFTIRSLERLITEASLQHHLFNMMRAGDLTKITPAIFEAAHQGVVVAYHKKKEQQ